MNNKKEKLIKILKFSAALLFVLAPNFLFINEAQAAVAYVGGQVGSFAGKTNATTVTFALTNGSASTPAAGDLVIVAYSVGSTADRALTIQNGSSVDYTLAGSELYQNDTYDSNLRVAYRFMPDPTETTVVLSGTGNTADAGAYTIHVFRGVDSSTPLDVAAVTAGNINTRLADPGSILPTTSGAWIYVTGGAAAATGGTYTASYLTDFRATTQVDTNDAMIGAGYVTWTSGTYDPAAFTGGGTDTTNDSWNAVTLALRPQLPTTTLGGGTNPGDATIGPGGAATEVDAFTFQTDTGTDSIISATTTLSVNSTSSIAKVEITSNDGLTVYGSSTNPTANSFSISLSGLTATSTGAVQYKIRITPKSHADMPTAPGSSYTVTSTITAWSGDNAQQAGSDATSSALTIDNLSPGNVSNATTTPGSGQVLIEWTNPVDSDFSNVIVVKSTSTPNSGTPTEGASYNVGDSLGNGTVIYNSNATSTTATGLTNGTTYYFKIFAKDTRGNYSATGVEASNTPQQATISVSGTCKQWDNSTNCANSELVRVAVNGTLQNASSTTSAGSWTITAVNQPNAGDVITVFLDGVAANNRAVAVSKYTSGNITGIELIERNLSIGAADNQTITNADLSQYDYSASTNDADLFFDVDASNNLNVDVNAAFSDEKLYVKTGNIYQPDSSGAQKIITSVNFENNGTSTLNGTIWRLAGSWKNAGNLNYGTSTVEFGGTGTIDDTNGVFYKLTASSTASITATSTFAVSDVFLIDGTFSINSGKTITASSTITLNGTISGSGTFKITSNNVPTGGALNAAAIVDLTSAAITIPARTFGANLTILNTGTTNRTATVAAGTVTVSGGLDIQSTDTGTVTLDAATNSANASTTGSLTFTGAGGTRTITTGASANTLTFGGNVNFTGGTYTAGSGNTLKMNGTGTLTSGSNTLKNLEINSGGTITLAAAIHTVSGNLILAGAGTPGIAGSTITMTGTGAGITGGNKTLNNLTIDPSSTGTVTLQTSDLTVSGTLNAASSDTLSIANGINLIHGGATLTLSGTISGAGKLIYRSSTAFPTAGTISSILRFDTLNNNQTMSARTYGGQVEIYNNTVGAKTVTMAAGTHSATNLYLYADSDGNITLDGQTNNATSTIGANLDFLGSGAGSEIITASSSPWTISGNMDISGGSFTAPSGNLNLAGNYTNTNGTFTHNSGTIVLNGSSQQTLSGTMSDSSAFNNLTITNNSGADPDVSPSIIFTATTTADTFTAATASTKIRFNASSTYAFTNINFNGQATTTRVALRSSNSTTTRWFFNVATAGTKTVSNTDVKDSDASLGDEISAADGTNLNSGGNVNWAFSITSPSVASVADEVFEINAVSTLVSDINITSGGGSPGGRIASSTDIRIVIPAVFNATWDNSITSITCVAGDSCAKISTSGITYESGDKKAVINAIQNFQNGNTIRVSGLKMSGFTAINASSTANNLRVDGAADAVDDANDTKVKTIKGKLAQQDHAAGQQTNLLNADSSSLTNLDLFRFKLVPTGENMTVATTTISLSDVFGFISANITNAKLYQDTNNDGDVDAGEPQLGANGTINIANTTGTIVFGGSWTATTTTNVVLRADVSSIDAGDSMAFSLNLANINSKGTTTLEIITTSGSSVSVSHGRSLKSRSGGSGSSESTPPGAGFQSGGAASGGSASDGLPSVGGSQTGGGSGGGGGESP